MAGIFKPMLSGKPNEKYPVRFPVLGSPKIDGIRGFIKDGVLTSRSGIAIPNRNMQELLGHRHFEGLDGELACGEPWDKNLMQQSTSGCMTEDAVVSFTYWVFDIWSLHQLSYSRRYDVLCEAFQKTEWQALADAANIRLLPHRLFHNAEELEVYEASCLAQGYEGVMVRSLDGPYKQGRSTAREGHLLKLKRYSDGEARIVGYEELMHNANEARVGELGQTKRSSHQENLVPMNKLGAFVCLDVATSSTFNVGTGYSDAQRIEFWANRDRHLGRLLKYKHFNHGVKEKPRHPVFIGFRDERDL